MNSSINKINIKYIAVSPETYNSSSLESLKSVVFAQSNDKNVTFPRYRFICGDLIEEQTIQSSIPDQDQMIIKPKATDGVILAYVPLVSEAKLNLKAQTLEIDSEYLFEPPKGMNPKHAVCMMMSSLRAYSAFFLKGKCLRDENILILNAGNWVGYIICQLATDIGCTVFAEARTQEQVKFLQNAKDYLKVRIIDSSKEKYDEVIKKETVGIGVNCVIDLLDTHTIKDKRSIIECLAPCGRWVCIDGNVQIDQPETMTLYLKNASFALCFEEAYEFFGMELGKARTMIEDGLEKLKNGNVKVFIETYYNSIKDFEDDKGSKIKCGSAIITLDPNDHDNFQQHV